jgi:uncharacterized integral membrane protein
MARNSAKSGQGGAGGGARKRETRDTVRLVVALVGLVLLIAFVLDNKHTVKVGFVFFSTQIDLIWVLLIAALLGGLVDRLITLLGQRRRKAAADKASRQLS